MTSIVNPVPGVSEPSVNVSLANLHHCAAIDAVLIGRVVLRESALLDELAFNGGFPGNGLHAVVDQEVVIPIQWITHVHLGASLSLDDLKTVSDLGKNLSILLRDLHILMLTADAISAVGALGWWLYSEVIFDEFFSVGLEEIDIVDVDSFDWLTKLGLFVGIDDGLVVCIC